MWKSWQGKLLRVLGLIYMHVFNEWHIIYPTKNVLKRIRIGKWNIGLWMDGVSWTNILCGWLGFILPLCFSLSLFHRGFGVSWTLQRISHFLPAAFLAEHLRPVHIHCWLGALKGSYPCCFLKNVVVERKIKEEGQLTGQVPAGNARTLLLLKVLGASWC